MDNNVKFLGKNPFKVYSAVEHLPPKLRNEFMGTLSYINSGGHPMVGEIKPLGIIAGTIINLYFPVIELEKNDFYVPLKMSFQWNVAKPSGGIIKKATYSPSKLFYIRGIGSRPRCDMLMKHFQTLLSSEYPGSLDVIIPGQAGNNGTRYVACLSNLTQAMVETFIHLILSSTGKAIHYSWLVPLQNLYESLLDNTTKKKTKGRLSTIQDAVLDNDQSGPIPGYYIAYGTGKPIQTGIAGEPIQTGIAGEPMQTGIATTYKGQTRGFSSYKTLHEKMEATRLYKIPHEFLKGIDPTF